MLQIDGGHHVGQQRTSDIAHDAQLMLLGYHVIRVGYEQVVNDWPAVQDVIMRAVAQGLHRRVSLTGQLHGAGIAAVACCDPPLGGAGSAEGRVVAAPASTLRSADGPPLGEHDEGRARASRARRRLRGAGRAARGARARTLPLVRRGCRARRRGRVRAARPAGRRASRRGGLRDRVYETASRPRRSRCSDRSPRVSTSSALVSSNRTRVSVACGRSSAPIVQSATRRSCHACRRKDEIVDADAAQLHAVELGAAQVERADATAA